MSKKKRSDHEIMVQDGLSKIEIFTTLQAGFEEYAKLFTAELPLQQKLSARFFFFAGAQVLYNMIAFPMGNAGTAEESGEFLMKALDQAQKEIFAYAEEARRFSVEVADTEASINAFADDGGRGLN